MVKTEIIEKIPIVIPSNESSVLTLFTVTSWKAKMKLSFNNLRNIFMKKLYIQSVKVIE
jgi:hypothetical protein